MLSDIMLSHIKLLSVIMLSNSTMCGSQGECHYLIAIMLSNVMLFFMLS